MIWVSRNGARIDCLGAPPVVAALLKADMIVGLPKHWWKYVIEVRLECGEKSYAYGFTKICRLLAKPKKPGRFPLDLIHSHDASSQSRGKDGRIGSRERGRDAVLKSIMNASLL